MSKRLTNKSVQIIEKLNESQLHYVSILTKMCISQNLHEDFTDKTPEWFMGALAGTQIAIENILHLEDVYEGFQAFTFIEGFEIRSYNLNTNESTPISNKVWHEIQHWVGIYNGKYNNSIDYDLNIEE